MRNYLILLLTLLATGCMRPTEEALRQPPCDPAARTRGCQAYPDAQGISLCELIRRPDVYDQHVVRVEAIFLLDAGDASFVDPACRGEGIIHPEVWFDDSYGVRAESQESLGKLLCQSGDYYVNKRVKMTLVGRFSVDTSGDRRRLKLNVLCIEAVTVLGP
jgi:hypothetical protein